MALEKLIASQMVSSRPEASVAMLSNQEHTPWNGLRAGWQGNEQLPLIACSGHERITDMGATCSPSPSCNIWECWALSMCQTGADLSASYASPSHLSQVYGVWEMTLLSRWENRGNFPRATGLSVRAGIQTQTVDSVTRIPIGQATTPQCLSGNMTHLTSFLSH